PADVMRVSRSVVPSSPRRAQANKRPPKTPPGRAEPRHRSSPYGRRRPAPAGTGEAGSTPPATASLPGTPEKRAADAPAPAPPGLRVSRTASPLSAQDVLDGRVLEGEFGIHPLELGVLRLELLQPLELGDRGPGILRPPLKVGRLADVVLPQDLGNRHTRLALLQNLDDLAFREPRLSHGISLAPESLRSKCLPKGEAYGHTSVRQGAAPAPAPCYDHAPCLQSW